MSWTPHATVATVVEKDGRYLIVEEASNGRQVLNQPAGHVEDGEFIVAAARRETLEETGWEIEPTHLIGIYTYKAPHSKVTYYRFCYAAKALQHHPDLPLDDDIDQVHWFTLDEITSRTDVLRSPLVLKCIEDYLAGQKFPLDLIYEHPLPPGE